MAWLVSLKFILISSGVVALALALKLYVPLAFEFAVTNFPTLWATCKSVLTPPYLYVFINAIILTIAASSMFHHEPKLPSSPHYEYSTPAPPVVLEEVGPAMVYEHVLDDVAEVSAVEVKEVITSMVVFDDNNTLEAGVDTDDRDLEVEEFSRLKTTPMRENVTKFDGDIVLPAQKPLVSSRFSHRKPARSNPEGGRPLRVAKAPKRHDTLENTWKTITEGRSVPLSRHIKKSNTWNNRSRGELVNALDDGDEVADEETYKEAVQKSKTFKDLKNQQREMTLAAVSSTTLAVVSSTTSPAAIRLRKEPSLSQDELNRKVEAFIRKFNEDMRLQRQESLNQYMEMIKRGSN